MNVLQVVRGWVSPAAWVTDSLELEQRRQRSLEAGHQVGDEWHRGKYWTPTEPVLQVVERERQGRA